MNINTTIERATQALDALAASITTPAQAGNIKAVRDALEELKIEDPQTYAVRLVPLLGKRLMTIMERGVQCIGADGLPQWDADGEPIYKEADRGLLGEALKYAEKHGSVKRNMDAGDNISTDKGQELRSHGRKKPVQNDDDEYDPRNDDE